VRDVVVDGFELDCLGLGGVGMVVLPVKDILPWVGAEGPMKKGEEKK